MEIVEIAETVDDALVIAVVMAVSMMMFVAAGTPLRFFFGGK